MASSAADDLIQATAPKTIQNVDAVLDKTQRAVKEIQDRLQRKAQEVDDAALAQMRSSLQEAQSTADDIVAQQEPDFASVQARLKQLGTPATDAPEPPDIAQQRAQLVKRQTALDAQIKLARLLGVEARQGQDNVSQLRRLRFQAQLGRRSQSVLNNQFWLDVGRDAPQDMQRLSGLFSALVDHMDGVPARVWSIALVLALALVLCGETARRGLAAFTVRHTSPTRLRRSIFAVLTVLVYTLIPGLLASIMLYVLHWNGEIDSALDTFLLQCMWAVYLAGFVAGLGTVLLSPGRSSWRLPQMTDRLARKLGWLPLLFAITIALAWIAQRMLELVNATLSTTVLVNGIMTLTLNILIGFTAWKLRSSLRKLARQSMPSDDVPAPAPVSPWARTAPSVLVAVIAISLAAFLLGFIALSSLIVQEIIWLGLVGCTTYLLVVLISDVFDGRVIKIREELEANVLNEQQARIRSQLFVLVSACLRLVLVLFSITLLLLPFGEAPGDWLQRRLGFLTAGFQVGEVTIKPASILVTLVVLLVGIYIVRVLRTWMMEQLLPVTRLDESMHTPTANLLGYLAYFAVIMMAFSSLGLGLERMAWIVSALSVGIGFGLQAVVQNFVSGVILVAERPIKVGDWVSLDGVEGNVRKISARATEIELFDRSTMIVPNSEFITKKVRNVTMANPLGVVSLKFNMDVGVNADAVRDIMLNAMAHQDDVLDKPAPSVTLDGFNETSLAFSASCYINSPRNRSRVRSALMFEILRKMRQADLTLHATQSVTVADPASGQGGVGVEEVKAPPLP